MFKQSYGPLAAEAEASTLRWDVALLLLLRVGSVVDLTPVKRKGLKKTKTTLLANKTDQPIVHMMQTTILQYLRFIRGWPHDFTTQYQN